MAGAVGARDSVDVVARTVERWQALRGRREHAFDAVAADARSLHHRKDALPGHRRAARELATGERPTEARTGLRTRPPRLAPSVTNLTGVGWPCLPDVRPSELPTSARLHSAPEEESKSPCLSVRLLSEGDRLAREPLALCPGNQAATNCAHRPRERARTEPSPERGRGRGSSLGRDRTHDEGRDVVVSIGSPRLGRLFAPSKVAPAAPSRPDSSQWRRMQTSLRSGSSNDRSTRLTACRSQSRAVRSRRSLRTQLAIRGVSPGMRASADRLPSDVGRGRGQRAEIGPVAVHDEDAACTVGAESDQGSVRRPDRRRPRLHATT